MSAARATLAGRWRQAVAALADRTFLVFETSGGGAVEWTYAHFDRLVAEVAGGLEARGVVAGSRIHLMSANSPAFVATWLAAARLQACIVPADPRSTPREVAEQAARTGPVTAVCGRGAEAAYREAVSAGAPLPTVVNEDDTEMVGLRGRPTEGLESVDQLAPSGVMFTSGTTSAPKGVVVTQANYAFAGEVMAAAAQLTQDDRQLVVLPLFHANAQYYSFAAAISVGASVALMPGFSAGRYLEQAARHGATHASLFAAPLRMILARGAGPVAGLRLRHCWYAQNITVEQHDQLSRLFGCRPRQLYGMTETIPAVLTSRARDISPGLMGTPSPGCEVDLWDESGSPVAAGEAGEIVVRGERGVTLFAGYLDDPGTTERAFRGEWFLTGDRAVRDAAGRYAFLGRGSDVLKVAGENVSVVEVEAVLAQHPAVFEAAVVGEPDAVRDEVPVAYVVRAPGHAGVGESELLEFTALHLAPAKRPRAVRFVDELPRTSVGKIRKFLLRPPAGAATGRGS